VFFVVINLCVYVVNEGAVVIAIYAAIVVFCIIPCVFDQLIKLYEDREAICWIPWRNNGRNSDGSVLNNCTSV